MHYGNPRSSVEGNVHVSCIPEKESLHNQAPLKPIISNNFLSRLQLSNL